ncbi:MAG: FeoB-associated Cys-rich membrane protein [Cellvibrio sp.]|uniref:FeoB-associated Cys-rich membrane protein n=1 Tax=Cellvibrio sp. TaxID=1965322 RepID=UPI00271C782B|nr:FeoB-associated Cys-rich membrane protein [Cellvibrio sp.]
MWQDIPWQEVIVGICVITAVIFLVRRWIFSSAKKSAACGGCGGCDKTSDASCSNPAEKTPH